MLRSLFKQSSIYFIALIGGKALTTLAWIIFARLFTQEFTGGIIFFVTLIEITTFIADFGLNQWYMKHADDGDEKTIYQHVTNTRLMTLIVSAMVLSIILLFTKSFNFSVSIICIMTLLPEAFLSIGDSYYLRKKQSYNVALKSIFSTIIFLSSVFIFKSQLTFSLIVLLYSISRTIVSIWYFPWKITNQMKIISLRQMISILSSSSAYALLILSSYLYARGDSIIIGYLAGPIALSLYGLSYRFLEGLSLFPSALTQNLFPISARKEGISKLQLQKMMMFMTFTGIVAGMVLFVAADVLVMILGSKYISAVPILRIFSVVAGILLYEAYRQRAAKGMYG
jgi:O-antigen/teichoic acid export membrane protein